MNRDVVSGPFLGAFAAVNREIVSMLASRWRTLLLAGAILFIPIGLIETVDALSWERLDADEDVDVAHVLEAVATTIANLVGTLLGEVVFAGVVTASVLVERGGGGTSLRELLGKLSALRLALADIVYTLVVVAGFLLLLVPGFIFLVWFALLAPVIEVEHTGVREGFARSRALVRRRPWLVAAFVLPITALDGVLTGFAHRASEVTVGEGFLGEWMAASLAELLTSLPLAVAVVVLYFNLSGPSSEPPASPRTPPREPRRSGPEATA